MDSENAKRNKRMQFWGKDENDDILILEIINGQKTATATSASRYYEAEEYDSGGWETGDIVDVYDLKKQLRCVIRITEVYPVLFGDIPDKLWKGEACKSREHFQDIHRECWPHYQLDNDFELIATHFELINEYPT
jgi:uncharacterized protein YhfF